MIRSRFVGSPSLARRRRRAAPITDTLCAELTERLLLGEDPERLVVELEARAVSRRVSLAAVEAILRSPIFAGGRRAARRARRYALLNRLERETARSAREPSRVERRAGVSADELFERYYAPGVPVVLTDILHPWRDTATWTPASLRTRLGNVEVEVTAGRDTDPAADAHWPSHAARVRFGDFCDLMESGSADVYMIANNLNGAKALAPLLDDLRAPHPYLDDARTGDNVLFWFGAAGTVTPLHHDTRNVLFCQIFGEKRVVLVPRFELAVLRAMRDEVYSRVDVDAFAPDALTRWEVDLGPGEGLFIPVGAFHAVTARTASLSVAFTGFRLPNDFLSYHPGRFAR